MEDRGGAAGFEGQKQCLSAIGRYVLVAAASSWDVGSGNNTKANAPQATSKIPASKRSSVIIYDLRNKYITMNSPLPTGETVIRVLQDGGAATAHVITSSGALIRFTEKSTASKLDVLLKKALYPLAISLAAEEQSKCV